MHGTHVGKSRHRQPLNSDHERSESERNDQTSRKRRENSEAEDRAQTGINGKYQRLLSAVSAGFLAGNRRSSERSEELQEALPVNSAYRGHETTPKGRRTLYDIIRRDRGEGFEAISKNEPQAQIGSKPQHRTKQATCISSTSILEERDETTERKIQPQIDHYY